MTAPAIHTHDLTKIFDAAFLGLYLILTFLALPSLVAMINTQAIGVVEGTREVGMVRPVGATARQLRRMVVIEALILALWGTTLGLASGLFLGRSAPGRDVVRRLLGAVDLPMHGDPARAGDRARIWYPGVDHPCPPGG